MRRSLVSLVFVVSGAQYAFGLNFPIASPGLHSETAVEPDASYNFEGIISLSNCSGSLVRFEDSLGTDKAKLLSNGHCVKFMGVDEVITNSPSVRSVSFLGPDGSKVGSASTTRILYAAMKYTDVSLYELSMTYDAIANSYHVQPMTISRTAPQIGDDIEVISGYWRKGYSCDVEFIAYQLKESNWSFRDSIRYSRPGCEVIGGTSGSPVVLAGSRTVVAVNNTINESGGRCTMNNPCEIDKDGNIFYQRGIGYAQQVFWFYDCRNEQGNIDLNQPACKLAKPL